MKKLTEFYKFISGILHPVVIPTIGLLVYFILIDLRLTRKQQLVLLSIVFIATYVVPILLLIVLKSTGSVKDFKANTIKERKIPVLFMIALFFFLGSSFNSSYITRDISLLFYGTSFALITVYLLFFLNLKTSLHMLSMGNAIGFFLLLQQIHIVYIIPTIIILVVLAGILGNSRLHLKAHTPKEVYVGFLIGLISQFITFYCLQ